MLIAMDKYTDEEHWSQPLQTKNRQYRIAVTFLTGYNGFSLLQAKLEVSIAQTHIRMMISLFFSILPGAYELQSLDNENKRSFIKDCYFTEQNHLFIIDPIFSTLGSIR